MPFLVARCVCSDSSVPVKITACRAYVTFLFPVVEKEVWSITAPFHPRATPWLQLSPQVIAYFVLVKPPDREAVAPLLLLSCLCTLRGLTPLCCFSSPRKSKTHHLDQSSSFRVFILGPLMRLDQISHSL